MKPIFAIGAGSVAVKHLVGRRALYSFAYVGTSWVSQGNIDDLSKSTLELWADSGAFTEWNRERTGKPSKGITVESWAEYLMTSAPKNITKAFSFDVIGDARASFSNWFRMLDMCSKISDKLIPVWHEGDPVEHLDAYLPNERVVGLGRTDGRRSEQKTFEFYDAAFNRYPDGKFHLLGNGNPTTIEPYPAFSFDWTGWERDAAYGNSHRWPWCRVSKETRIRAYIEAAENIAYRPVTKPAQIEMFTSISTRQIEEQDDER